MVEAASSISRLPPLDTSVSQGHGDCRGSSSSSSSPEEKDLGVLVDEELPMTWP